MESTPIPSEIRLDRSRRILKISFEHDASFDLPSEYLRVYSQSAEVKGHGSGQGILQTGKGDVKITDVKPVGNYAVQLVFDDGHDTGLYSWPYLYELCYQKEAKWQAYLSRLKAAGHAHPDQDEP